MSYETERVIVQTAFVNAWGSLTPVQYDDEDFTAPEDQVWCRVSILNGEAQNRSVGAPGSNVIRHVGVVAIQVHVPTGAGQVGFTTYAEAIEAAFRNRTIENVRFLVPYVSGAPQEMGAFTSRTMMCPFTRDEFNG